jgi:sulfur carrier protein
LPSNAERNSAFIDFPEGASVQDVLKELKIPEAMPKILLVNGRHAEIDKVLAEGDTLSIFPPIAGG